LILVDYINKLEKIVLLQVIDEHILLLE